MGKIKYIKDIREFLKDNPLVSINSLKNFIKKNDKSYVYLLVSNLLKNKEIKKVTKGFYSTYDDPSLVVLCFKPAYLGLQNASSFHNLWEQETNPVVLTSSNVREGVRTIFGRNVIVKKINPKYLFGFEYFKYPLEGRDIYLPYSDIEKTFIDLVYYKQPIDEETLENFRKNIKRAKLNSYLKHYPVKTRARVLKVFAR